MTTCINRSQDGKDKILTDEDINLLDDAISSLLLKNDFFEASPWNRLKINTAWIRPSEEDVNIISCHGDDSLTEEQARFLHGCQSFELGTYFETLGDALEEVGAGIAIAIGGSAIRGGARIVTGVFRVEEHAIFLLGSCRDEEEDFKTLSLGICGLAHLVFKILRAKHPIIKDMIPPIELEKYVDKATNDAIAKRIASWFTSGRDSVEKWRASLG